MNRKKIGLLLISMAGLMGASVSSAVEAGMSAPPHALSVPASACTPFRTEDSHRLRITNGYWHFKDGETGTAKLECPYTGGAIATHMYGPGGFSEARVMLRDGDGEGEDSWIKVWFISRTGGPFDVSGIYNSNNPAHGDSTNTYFRVDSTSSSIGPQLLGTDTLGSFKVNLYRANQAAKAYFTGIILMDGFLEY